MPSLHARAPILEYACKLNMLTLLVEDAERVLSMVTYSGNAWYQKGYAHFHLKEYSAAVSSEARFKVCNAREASQTKFSCQKEWKSLESLHVLSVSPPHESLKLHECRHGHSLLDWS